MKRKPDFAMQNVGGEYLLVPLGAQVMDMNGIITLNATGACIWEALEVERTTDEVAALVAERFDVALEQARADVEVYVAQIAEMGLIEA